MPLCNTLKLICSITLCCRLPADPTPTPTNPSVCSLPTAKRQVLPANRVGLACNAKHLLRPHDHVADECNQQSLWQRSGFRPDLRHDGMILSKSRSKIKLRPSQPFLEQIHTLFQTGAVVAAGTQGMPLPSSHNSRPAPGIR